MILAVDVDYKEEDKAVASGVLFDSWEDGLPTKTLSVSVNNVLPYESGQFYKRELPCILALLEKIEEKLDCIVVDGYVNLGKGKRGLGAYLFDALDGEIPIIGVAKNAFKDIEEDTFLYRGESKKPLYITSAGIAAQDAKEAIRRMHGKYRFPTLLKEVDHICRTVGYDGQ